MASAPNSEDPRPRRGRPRTFEALAENRDYRKFYIGHGVSLVGTWMQAAAVNWIVYDLTRSELWLGVVEAANLLPGLLVGLFAGALADRTAPRSTVLATQLVQLALAVTLATLFNTGSIRLWQLIALLAMARVGNVFEMPARQVFLYELVGREHLGNAIALNVGLFNASRVVGPALAGVCLAWLGQGAPFVLNALSFLAAIAAVLSIPARPSHHVRSGQGPGDVLGGLGYLKRDRRVACLFGLMAFFGVAGMGYNAMLSAYARDSIGLGALGYSALLASGGAGAVAGALCAARVGGRVRREVLIVLGLGLFSLSLSGMGTLPGALGTRSPSWWPTASAMTCLLGAGFGAITFTSSIQTMIQLDVPDALRGRVAGVWMIVFSGSVPMGALLTGRLAQWFGVGPILLASGVVCGTVALLLGASGLLNRLGRPSAPTDRAEGQLDPARSR
ncbi:MFS transporter [Tautonia plasticadhaerens]|uniref:Enterobactin exporter EntS n=1 Tax=Tautonia plasticadhaerens TaxID=2527974 RepID=A0A518GYS8_9BACT|nr:MFS transporter [Tautonia plasticadhaerens]QDV33760.1 enterobactin exporter EntS [Tautonia plasticadhaerens]